MTACCVYVVSEIAGETVEPCYNLFCRSTLEKPWLEADLRIKNVQRDDLHLFNAAVKGYSGNHALSGTPAGAAKSKIPQAVENHSVIVEFNSLQNVGMMADDYIRARMNRLVGNCDLVRFRFVLPFPAPVE